MKKFLALLLCLIFVVTCFAGCSKKNKYDRENFIFGTKEFVELCDIESFEFSEQDENYKKYVSDIIKSDLSNSQFAVEVKEGEVKDGDIANINYVGSVKGVRFTGGTAEKFDLTIGSGQFIEGFEEQLIGVKIGETVTITVKFPEGYNDSTDLETGKNVIKLSNQEAQFEVKINSIKRPYSEVNDDFAVAAGFKNAEEYNEQVKKSAVENLIYSYLLENCKVLDYPTDEEGTPYSYFKNYYTSYAQQNGSTFEGFLSANNLTETQFRQEVLKDIVIMYACFDKLELSLDDSYEAAVNAKVKELAENNNVTEDKILETYPKSYIESQLVIEKTMSVLYERAKVTE